MTGQVPSNGLLIMVDHMPTVEVANGVASYTSGVGVVPVGVRLVKQGCGC